MIAMLAGATTSPEGKFGDYTPPKGPQAIEADRAKERKAITALLNALLSIGGAAFATWWAADKLRWTNEWVRGNVCQPVKFPNLLRFNRESFFRSLLR